MDGRSIIDLVAGPQLLAIAENGPEPISSVGWVSDDGVAWTSLGQLGTLDDLYVMTLAATEEWYLAGGQERCDAQPCRAAVYRSRDGFTWERASGSEFGALSTGWGTVLDIATTGNGLLAVGSTDDELAIWTSIDGSQWNRVARNEPLFQPANVMVQVRDIDMSGEPFAQMVIGGQLHRLAPNSEVLTDAGALRVNRIGPETVALEWEDGWGVDTEPGPIWGSTLSARPASVHAQGSRILIAGDIGVHRNPIPAVWYSADAGKTWIRRIAEPWQEGAFTGAILRGDHLVTTGVHAPGNPFAPLIWHSTWDTAAAEAEGIESVRAFVDALNDRDTNAVAAAVPQWSSELRNPIIELPTLGRANAQWWDSAGLIDVDAVANTLAYLDDLNTTIEIERCTSRLLLGEIERLQVSCGFKATSDLMDVMSYEGATGKLDVSIEYGVFEWATLSVSPSETLWQYLTSGTVGAKDEDRSTIVSANADGQMRFDPIFNAQTAAVHLRLATVFAEGLLRPGETKVVDTVLGTMEWQWREELPVPVYTFDWVTRTEIGFIALGHGEPGRWTETSTLWLSVDGLEWTQMPAPDAIDSIWNVEPYRDGLVAQAWDDRSFLLVFDGDEWSEIEFPDEAGDYVEVTNLAVSGDTILAFTGSWTEEAHGLVASNAWLVGPDRVPRQTTLPPEISWSEETMGLVGSEEGFVLATSQYGTPTSPTIWHSSDGKVWSLIARRTSIDDALYVWGFQHHLTEYFVVGEGAETRCTTTEEQGQICQQLFGLWSSPDGAAWDQVLTDAGEPLAAHEVASGPLGMAAVAMEYYENKLPRPIYLSADGQRWDRAGNLGLVNPDVSWWWVNTPAVGTDTIIIPGATYDDSSGTDGDVPFVIVGRLLEP
jgi:hypothetical protein